MLLVYFWYSHGQFTVDFKALIELEVDILLSDHLNAKALYLAFHVKEILKCGQVLFF